MNTTRPRRFAAVALLLLLGGTGFRPAAAQDAANLPGVTVDAEGYTDRVLGFRLALDPRQWVMRERKESWFGAHPPAVSFARGRTTFVAVHVRDAGGRTLAENALRLAEQIVLDAPPRRGLLSGDLAGLRSIVFDARSRVEGLPAAARVHIAERDGLVYSLVIYDAGGGLMFEGVDGIVLPAFRVLDAAEFRRAAPAPDVDGTGWRMRGGIADHALAGVRFSLAPGWRFGVAPGTPDSLAAGAVNLYCPSLELGVRIQGLPLEGRTWEKAGATIDFLRDLMYVRPKENCPPVDFGLDGGTIHMEWFIVRGDRVARGGILKTVQWGRLRGDGRLVTLEVIHPRRFDPRLVVSIRDALARISVLSDGVRTALAAEFEGAPDPQVAVRPEEYLRRGIYRNVRHRIVWKKPSPLWSLVRGQEIVDGKDVIAEMSNPDSGVTARLWTFPAPSVATKWTIHDRLVSAIRSLFGDGVASKPQPASLGSRDSVRSELRIPIGDMELTCHIVTTNPAANITYGVTVMCYSRERAKETVETILAGLRFQTGEIPVARKSARGWEDPGHGFRIEVPTGAVKVTALPPEFAGGGGAMVAVESGSDRMVVAACEWPDGDPELESSAVGRVLARLDPDGTMAGRFGAVRDVPGTVGGEVTRDRIHEGSPFIRVARLRRAGALYVIGIATAGPGPAPEIGPASWFKFTD